jgi:ribosome biogenesis protein SSF1/2
VGKVLSQLVRDLRLLMAPNTFSKLRESKRNSVQDFVHVAGSLGATHLMRVSNNDKNVGHLHLSKMPAGPSFDFKLDKFSLIADLRAKVQSGAIGLSKDDERYAPVAILNGFKQAGNDEIAQLLSEAIKGLVPPIDIGNINIKTCRRVILFNYDAESTRLSIRHFRISLTKKSIVALPSGPSCGVILNARKSSRIPDLSKLVSIAELVTPRTSGALEDSEEASQVEIVTSKSNKKASLVLSEIGPRIEATLSRVMAGVEEGTILFSKFAPETVGSTVAKKKVKHRVNEAPRKSRKKQRESLEQEEDLEMMSD